MIFVNFFQFSSKFGGRISALDEQLNFFLHFWKKNSIKNKNMQKNGLAKVVLMGVIQVTMLPYNICRPYFSVSLDVTTKSMIWHHVLKRQHE